MKGNILVIEDNEQNLYLVRFILEKNGYIEKPINPDTFVREVGAHLMKAHR